MSDDTPKIKAAHEKLDEAVRELLAAINENEQEQGLLKHWILITEEMCVDADDEQKHMTLMRTSKPAPSTATQLGLLGYMDTLVRQYIADD